MGPFNNDRLAILFHEERLRNAERARLRRAYLQQARNHHAGTHRGWRRLWHWLRTPRARRITPRKQMSARSLRT